MNQSTVAEFLCGRAAMSWHYRKIDLNEHAPRGDLLDVLNEVGADGWELVTIAANNVAYLRRRIEPPAPSQDTTGAKPKRRSSTTST